MLATVHRALNLRRHLAFAQRVGGCFLTTREPNAKAGQEWLHSAAAGAIDREARAHV